MDLIVVVCIAVLIGAFVLLITTQVKMPPGYARTIQLLALVLLVLWILRNWISVPNVLR